MNLRGSSCGLDAGFEASITSSGSRNICAESLVRSTEYAQVIRELTVLGSPHEYARSSELSTEGQSFVEALRRTGVFDCRVIGD